MEELATRATIAAERLVWWCPLVPTKALAPQKNLTLFSLLICQTLDPPPAIISWQPTPRRVLVGYGLTETSPVIANRVAMQNTRGTTGRPVPGSEVKIADLETGQQVQCGRGGGQRQRGVRGLPRFRLLLFLVYVVFRHVLLFFINIHIYNHL